MSDSTTAPVKVKAMVVDFGLTLKVQVCAAPSWRWRCALGIRLLGLAARLIGVGLDVSLVARRRHVRNSRVEDGLPRRLSFDEPEAHSHGRLSIKLDGAEQGEVLAYDIDAGTITQARRDAAGDIMVDEDRVLYQTVEGRVEVTRLPAA